MYFSDMQYAFVQYSMQTLSTECMKATCRRFFWVLTKVDLGLEPYISSHVRDCFCSQLQPAELLRQRAGLEGQADGCHGGSLSRGSSVGVDGQSPRQHLHSGSLTGETHKH